MPDQPDLSTLRQHFQGAIEPLPNYKRRSAWEYVKALEAKVKRLENELEALKVVGTGGVAGQLVEDLTAKVHFLLNYIGYGEDGCFTFPDGDVWRRENNPNQGGEPPPDVSDAEAFTHARGAS